MIDGWVDVAPHDGNGWVDVATPKAAAPQSSRLERFGTGLMDPIYGAEQLALHAVPVNDFLHDIGVPGIMSAKQFDQWLADREKRIRAGEPAGTDWWRVAGNVANPLNYVAPEGTEAGRIGEAVLGGMRGAALQPATGKGDFLTEKGKQIAEGGAAGGATGGAAQGVGKVIAGRLREPASDLAAAGVRMTPGQQAGGIVRRAEEAAKSLPVVGSAIRHGEATARQDFNKAAYNRVLTPIGATYHGDEIGYDGVKRLQSQLSAAYDAALHGVRFVADPKFAVDLHALDTLAAEMPPDKARQFRTILKNRVAQRLAPNGTMDGETFKQVESELNHKSSTLHSSADAADRELGDTIDQLNALLRENLERNNPEKAADLAKANAAWAMFARVRKAAGQRTSSGGVFTPGDLLAASKSLDKSVGKGTFARGDALLQNFGNSGEQVLTSRMPNSGTPERLMWDIGGLGAGYEFDPRIPLAMGAASLPYTKPAMTLQHALTTAGAGPRRATAGVIEGTAPVVAPGIGAAVANPSDVLQALGITQ